MVLLIIIKDCRTFAINCCSVQAFSLKSLTRPFEFLFTCILCSLCSSNHWQHCYSSYGDHRKPVKGVKCKSGRIEWKVCLCSMSDQKVAICLSQLQLTAKGWSCCGRIVFFHLFVLLNFVRTHWYGQKPVMTQAQSLDRVHYPINICLISWVAVTVAVQTVSVQFSVCAN